MRTALVAVLAVGSSCSAGRAAGPGAPPDELSRSSSMSHPNPVVLVTIDGARWQEVFDGSDTELSLFKKRPASDLVPNLDRLVRERGAAIGAPGRGLIRATGPNFISLPGYTEILTGRASIGCQSNGCKTIEVPTVLDEAHAAGGSVAVFGSWEVLDRAVSARPGSFLVSCGRSNDPGINPWPGDGDFRPDRLTAQLALEHLEAQRPDVLYISLGEPDEYGHRNDYAGYLRALAYADGVVGRIFEALDRMGPRGARTHVFVTADHGRSRDFKGHGGWAPESARVWLFAAGPSITARGRVVSTRERHLADIAPTLRSIAGLPPDDQGHHDRDHGWRGHSLDELTTPIGQDTPSPPSPQ